MARDDSGKDPISKYGRIQVLGWPGIFGAHCSAQYGNRQNDMGENVHDLSEKKKKAVKICDFIFV